MRKKHIAALFTVLSGPSALAGGLDIGPLYLDTSIVKTLNPPPIITRPVAGSQVWKNGVILTMDGQGSQAEAIWLEGDRIRAVGSNADAAQWGDPATVQVDLAGKVVMPGFIDGHGHFPGGALGRVGADLNSPPIGDVEDIPEAFERIRVVVKNRNSATNLMTAERHVGQGSEWLFAFGYDDTQIREKRHLTRQDLDQLSETDPIYVMHISGHIGYVNSAGLSKLGITRDTPDPEGGHIGRDEQGEPNGVLYETAREEVQAAALNFALREQALIVDLAVRQAAEQGYTTVQNGQASAAFARSIAAVSRAGLVPQRVMMFPDQHLGERLASGEANALEFSGGRAVLGAIKLVADGSIQGYTGYLNEPYYDPGDHEQNYHGYPTQSAEALAKAVLAFHCENKQIAIHGNGDAAIDNILNAIDAANAACPRSDTRHIIIHAQMARSDQLARMKALGVTPSFFAAHVYYWGDRHVEIFMGPDRAARMSPLAESEELGLRYSTHLDTPVVPLQSWMQLWSAVERTSAKGVVIGEEQRASRMGALRALTSDAAWQVFMENEVGSIEPGKFADLVVSEHNPLDPDTDLQAFRVGETWVGGQQIWPQQDRVE